MYNNDHHSSLKEVKNLDNAFDDGTSSKVVDVSSMNVVVITTWSITFCYHAASSNIIFITSLSN